MGWSASVDGHATPVRTSSLGLQEISLPPGRHHVRFAYRPPRILAGYVAFVLAVALLLLITPWGALARRRACGRLRRSVRRPRAS